jgi:uncharacterized membrane protein (Fun14 family)
VWYSRQKVVSADSFYSVVGSIGGGFLVGTLIGYALKKVVKLVAIVVGLFFAGIAYLQYQQILNINWNKLQATSQNTLSTLANSTMQIPGFHIDHTAVLSTFSAGTALIFLITTVSPMAIPALFLIIPSTRIIPFPSSDG